MYELIYSQENMFFLSLVLGSLMGISYDVFRGLRRIFPHHNLTVALEDFLYWIFWTLTLILIIQNRNNGILRLYIFVALLLGLLVYICTISRIYLFILSKIILFLKKVTKKANNMLKCVVKKVRIKPTLKWYRKINGDR